MTRAVLPPLINEFVDTSRRVALGWQRWLQELTMQLGYNPSQRIWQRAACPHYTASSTGTTIFGTITLAQMGPSVDAEISGCIPLPHAFDGLRVATPYCRYLAHGAGSGDIVLNLDYQVCAPGEAASATPTTDSQTVAGATTAVESTLVEFDAIESDDLAPGAVLVFRLQREATHVDDTFSVGLSLIEFGLAVGVYGIGRVSKYA